MRDTFLKVGQSLIVRKQLGAEIDLKEKMKELIENNKLRNKLTENSKLRRDDFFGWDEYAKKLEDLYKEIISGNI